MSRVGVPASRVVVSSGGRGLARGKVVIGICILAFWFGIFKLHIYYLEFRNAYRVN